MTCSVNNDSRDDVLVERLLNSSDANARTITGGPKIFISYLIGPYLDSPQNERQEGSMEIAKLGFGIFTVFR